MSSTPFIGEIIMFAGNFAPRGWALCDGQLLNISSYSALFSILGTTYGGDGRTTFGLPDLRGRVPMHAGTGAGLTARSLGAKGGTETTTLTSNQLPAHSHGLMGTDAGGSERSPVGNSLATHGSTAPPLGPYAPVAPDQALHAGSVADTGGGAPVDNIPPFQCVNFIIALEGTYPSRS